MWKIKLILVFSLLAPGSTPIPLAQAALMQRIDVPRAVPIDDLWLDISLGRPLLDWFNLIARPQDIARVDQVRQVDLLDDVTVGRKLVVFKSVEEAEVLVPRIADRIDIIGYNLEHGPGYPLRDQEDPVASAQRMHDLAEEYELALAFGPDHDFALSHGVEVAPYVDMFIIQVQRVQTEPATVLDFALPLMQQLHEANPDLEISVQVRTEGDVVAIVDLIDSLSDSLSGVSILTSAETVHTAEALVTELRTRKSAVIESTAKQATLVAKTETEVASVSTQTTGPSWQLILVGALAAGAIAGGLVSTLICIVRGKPSSK